MRASTLGTQSFFQYLSRYSNLPALQAADTTKVITTTHHLEHGHLSQLFTHQVVAVHVKQYIPPSIALELAAHYSAISRRGGSSNWEVTTERGLESSDVQTIGTPSNMQTSAPDPSFHATIAATLQSYRSPVHPIHPLDKLRLDLDELHPSGCTIKKSPSGRPFNPGLPRITQGPTRWRSGFIHVDDLSPMTADQGTFSANIYLQNPSTLTPYPTVPLPGSLTIWPCKWTRKLDFYRNATLLAGLTTQSAEMQAALRAKLRHPITIEIAAGDLVLLCVQRPHCVVGFKEGMRVSLQTFLGYEEGKPIIVES